MDHFFVLLVWGMFLATVCTVVVIGGYTVVEFIKYYPREILETLRRSEEIQLRILQKIELILDRLTSHDITGFTITQQGEPNMPLAPIAPGNSPVFTATPIPSTSVPATPPTWISSDATNAPISVDPTGLIVTVAIPTSATVGATFTLNISYTNADGSVATASTTQTIVSAPSPDITGFNIVQTA